MDWNKVAVCGLSEIHKATGIEFVIEGGLITNVVKEK